MAIMRTHADRGRADRARGAADREPRAGGAQPPRAFRRQAAIPTGSCGEAIPHVARIVAVADSFNAMIGRRPYRPPLAPSVALERLVEGRGDQFDPDVVDAMIEVVTART